MARAEGELGAHARRLHYLSVPPRAFGDIVARSGPPSWLTARGSCWRSRSAPTSRARARSMGSSTASSRRSGCSGSTTSSAARRCRTYRAALRQRHVRAGVEPRSHRPRADRRPRDARRGRPCGLLRGHRRLPRHGRDPPVPRPRLRGHGAADDARGALDRRGDRQGVPVGLPHRPGRRDPRPIRRLPRRPRCRRGLADGDLHRAPRRASTTGAGPACPSSCARASAWPSSGGC